MRGVFGLASFANGCPTQTDNNVTSMDYLRCGQASHYRNKDTLANFLFVRGSEPQEAAVVLFWQQWWAAHPELRKSYPDGPY